MIKRSPHEHGIALLLVISLLVLITAVVSEFQFSSRVDYRLATAARDSLQAEYNALSAIRVRALLIRHISRQGAMLQTAIASVAGGLGVQLPPGGFPIAQLINSIPVECSLLSMIVRAKDAPEPEQDKEGNPIGGESFFPGDCLATSRNESSMISLEGLDPNNNTTQQTIIQAMAKPLMGLKYERHFQEYDRMGQHADSALELFTAIADWQDADRQDALSPVSDEDRHYRSAKNRTKVKNAHFNSIDEIQLVYGVDDELFEILKKRFTIYGSSTGLAIASLSPARIMEETEHALLPGVDIQSYRASPEYAAALQLLQAGTSIGLSFQPLTVASFTTTVVAGTGIGAYLDVPSLNVLFTDNADLNWHTITGFGRVGDASYTIALVFHAAQGRFYHAKVE